MPVFDFSSTPENEKKQDPICTYTTFRSNEGSASAEKPILILDKRSEKWNHHGRRCIHVIEQTDQFRI